MKPATASLTPLVTCPAFYLLHVLGAVICIPSLLHASTSANPATGGYVAAFVIPVWSAYVLTSLQRDLHLRPLSFCLPGHRDALRRTLFLVGIATSLVASLTVLTHPELRGLELLGAVWSSFCFGMVAYLLVVVSMLAIDHFMAALGPAIVVGAILLESETARILVQEAALFSPGWNTVALAALSVLTWRRLGKVTLSRKLCGGSFLSLQMMWRRSASEEFAETSKRQTLAKGVWGARAWLLRQCYARILRRPALSLRRHLAAEQYQLAGRLIPFSASHVVFTAGFVLVLMVVAGYLPPKEGGPEAPAANAIYVLSCLLAMNLRVPMFATMLLPAGRKETFWTSIAIAGGNGLVVLGFSVTLFLSLLGIGTLAPPLSIDGTGLHFQPADLAPAVVPLALLPIAIILRLVCRRWLLVPAILVCATAMLLLTRGGAIWRNLSPLALAGLLSVSWTLLVSTLYVFSFHKDLARD